MGGFNHNQMGPPAAANTMYNNCAFPNTAGMSPSSDISSADAYRRHHEVTASVRLATKDVYFWLMSVRSHLLQQNFRFVELFVIASSLFACTDSFIDSLIFNTSYWFMKTSMCYICFFSPFFGL